MRDFVQTDAGQGTICVCVACGIIAWPPLLAFVAAAVLLAFAFLRFREVFRRVDEEIAGDTVPPDGRQPEPSAVFTMPETVGVDGINLNIRY